MHSVFYVFALLGCAALTYAFTTPTDCMMSGCGMGGICSDTGNGQSECICYQGFQKSNITFMCEDYNECMDTSVALCPNGECFNIVGTYRCSCYPGFRPGIPDGKVCVRIGGMGSMGPGSPNMPMFPTLNQLMRCRMMRQMIEM